DAEARSDASAPAVFARTGGAARVGLREAFTAYANVATEAEAVDHAFQRAHAFLVFLRAGGGVGGVQLDVAHVRFKGADGSGRLIGSFLRRRGLVLRVGGRILQVRKLLLGLLNDRIFLLQFSLQ